MLEATEVEDFVAVDRLIDFPAEECEPLELEAEDDRGHFYRKLLRRHPNPTTLLALVVVVVQSGREKERIDQYFPSCLIQ